LQKILHIERSTVFQKAVSQFINHCGQIARSVSSIAAAFDALRSESFDLIMTAITLDDGSAEDFVRALSQSEFKKIPIIVLTSTDSLEQRERLFSLGVVDYMLKSDLSADRLRRYFEALALQDELSRFMRTLRIAVLDDSALILKIISNILSMNGIAQATFFSDPRILLASKERYDVYVTDMVLPGISGEQVVSDLRAVAPNAIIISMSRFTSERPLANLLLAGADDYIHKPFEASAFMSRLRLNVRAYQLKRSLEHLASYDALTNVYNRGRFLKGLEGELSKALKTSRPLSFFMVDLDDFKKVNDRWGHLAGDEALVAVSRSAQAVLRTGDLLGRFGGEEFVVALPDTELEGAIALAEALRVAVEGTSFAGRFTVTASIGVAQLVPGERTDDLIARADTALYGAKKAGKNRVIPA